MRGYKLTNSAPRFPNLWGFAPVPEDVMVETLYITNGVQMGSPDAEAHFEAEGTESWLWVPDQRGARAVRVA